MDELPQSRPRVILVHGFNVRDGGAGSVGKLRPYFERAGFRVHLFRYGWLGLLGVRLLDGRFAQLLTDMAEPGDVIVGHSNGCCIAQRAAELGAPFGQMVFINPALDPNVSLPKQISALHVWHSPSDGPVALARCLPWHRWGDMGAVGYRGPFDARVRNYDKEFGYRVKSSKHSDVFEDEKLEYFGPRIVAAVVDYKPTVATVVPFK